MGGRSASGAGGWVGGAIKADSLFRKGYLGSSGVKGEGATGSLRVGSTGSISLGCGSAAGLAEVGSWAVGASAFVSDDPGESSLIPAIPATRLNTADAAIVTFRFDG
ncbi:MAG: hypothetical protein JWO38_3721 [Gemmataceae bacterium]|nr:hypothetical protein [Gemmataceae bacterium]